MIKVYLVDDHAILLNGLVSILKEHWEFEVVGTAQNVADALQFLRVHKPDILITDYNLPDDNGLALVRKARSMYPELKVLVLSMHDEVHLVKEILKEGVNGYVLKKDSEAELVQALHDIRNGKTFLSNDINRILIQNLHGDDEQKLLTDREREILKLIAKEFTNKDIATELFISERTVETHRKNIFRKTKTSSLVGLIKFAYANNLI